MSAAPLTTASVRAAEGAAHDDSVGRSTGSVPFTSAPLVLRDFEKRVLEELLSADQEATGAEKPPLTMRPEATGSDSGLPFPTKGSSRWTTTGTWPDR